MTRLGIQSVSMSPGGRCIYSGTNHRAWLLQIRNLLFLSSFRGYRVAVRLHTADGLSRRFQIAPHSPVPPASGCFQLPASHRCSRLCPALSSSPAIFPTWSEPCNVALVDLWRLLNFQRAGLIRARCMFVGRGIYPRPRCVQNDSISEHWSDECEEKAENCTCS